MTETGKLGGAGDVVVRYDELPLAHKGDAESRSPTLRTKAQSATASEDEPLSNPKIKTPRWKPKNENQLTELFNQFPRPEIGEVLLNFREGKRELVSVKLGELMGARDGGVRDDAHKGDDEIPLADIAGEVETQATEKVQPKVDKSRRTWNPANQTKLLELSTRLPLPDLIEVLSNFPGWRRRKSEF